MTRNLVVVRTGHKSLHSHWLKGAEPAFDLLVTAYEETPAVPSSPRIRQISLPGRKMEGYYRLFTESTELLRNYDQIALFDDDRVTQSSSTACSRKANATLRSYISPP